MITPLHGLRRAPLIGFFATASAMAFALLLQYGYGLEPCPMCIFQRVAMVSAGVAFLLWGLHAPAGFGRYVYAALATLACGAGALIAGRHVWLQNLPEGQAPACGPSLDYLMDVMPAWDVVQTVLRGDGNCAKIDWEFLGLSLPAWTLVGFGALVLWSMIAVVATRYHGLGAIDQHRPNPR